MTPEDRAGERSGLCVPVVDAFRTGEGSAVTLEIPITGEATAGKPEARETAAANDLKVLFVINDSNEVQR